tara:strand:- start:1535 stop:1798 length:264 start_codon:yes stop_codon:yes gene_type:complete
MMKSEDQELIHYLRDALDRANKLVGAVSERNKTKKFKAIASLLMLTTDKLKATLHFARAGGYEDLSVITQKHTYDPVIEWLTSEISY